MTEEKITGEQLERATEHFVSDPIVAVFCGSNLPGSLKAIDKNLDAPSCCGRPCVGHLNSLPVYVNNVMAPDSLLFVRHSQMKAITEYCITGDSSDETREGKAR